MLSEMGLLSIQSFILFLLLFFFYYIREMDGIKNETSQEGRIFIIGSFFFKDVGESSF